MSSQGGRGGGVKNCQFYLVKRQLRGGGGGGAKSPILTPQKKTSSHIFKMAISSKFFGDATILIIRVNADKRKKKEF